MCFYHKKRPKFHFLEPWELGGGKGEDKAFGKGLGSAT